MIIGAGPIGLMFVKLAKDRGARVIIAGRNASKLDMARSWGADEVVTIEDLLKDDNTVTRLTPEGEGVDICIEAVGQPRLWEKAVSVTRKGGLTTFFGGCEEGTSIQLDTKMLHYSDKRMIGVFHHTPDYIKAALTSLSTNGHQFESLISDDLSLSDLVEAFANMGSRNALKFAIHP